MRIPVNVYKEGCVNLCALNNQTHQFRYHWNGIPLRLECVVHVDVLEVVCAARSIAGEEERKTNGLFHLFWTLVVE